MNIIATFFSGQDMLIIFLIVLLLFGAKKLPELARGMGQAVREFNKAKEEIEREISKPANELAIQPAPDKQPYNPVAAAPVAPVPIPPVATPAPAVILPEAPVATHANPSSTTTPTA